MEIARGQRFKLADILPSGNSFELNLNLSAGGLKLDAACFGLDSNKKLSDEAYMTFFNQPETPCGGVKIDGMRFTFDLERIPARIESLVITLAVDGPGTLSTVGASHLQILKNSEEAASHRFDGTLFVAERAIMLFDLYRKDGTWRGNAIGQGFNGGLDALIVHFGGTVAEFTQPVSPPAPSKVISLEKQVEQEAPHLVSLVKKVGISLEKAGLTEHRARVALCLDISGSMASLYSSGQMSAFTDRIFALAARFDDDGQLDVFLFGNKVHQPEPMSLAGSSGYLDRLMKQYRLEGGTHYGLAIEAIRKYYYPNSRAKSGIPVQDKLPVYVMFVTDGQTFDEDKTIKEIREASFEPIFWKFMGIGKSNKGIKKGFLARLGQTDFSFLEKLDDLQGRYIDNADFFSVERPDQQTDESLYDLLLNEYKGWIQTAHQKNLLS
ncbi:MAG: VWA domain-containing protein [Sulfuricellaceae bacterium]|nr:VWA domain-containing protein [Sulfuricellaceae bacterium]